MRDSVVMKPAHVTRQITLWHGSQRPYHGHQVRCSRGSSRPAGGSSGWEASVQQQPLRWAHWVASQIPSQNPQACLPQEGQFAWEITMSCHRVIRGQLNMRDFGGTLCPRVTCLMVTFVPVAFYLTGVARLRSESCLSCLSPCFLFSLSSWPMRACPTFKTAMRS